MLNSVLVGLVAGVGGTGLGSLIAVLLGKRKIAGSVLFPFTVGIMLSVVCFELLPEAIDTIGVLNASLFVVAG
ncbi:MAG: ZIP family metal transporter, partial [Clostridia bacterium]|nr:ZIP family metal transporter [Clostridia bacterium]